MKEFPVKVQISQLSSDGKTRVLIYDRQQRHKYEGEATPEVLMMSHGRAKFFAWAHMEGTVLTLGDEAPEQPW